LFFAEFSSIEEGWISLRKMGHIHLENSKFTFGKERLFLTGIKSVSYGKENPLPCRNKNAPARGEYRHLAGDRCLNLWTERRA
jgi:hypothetical protein